MLISAGLIGAAKTFSKMPLALNRFGRPIFLILTTLSGDPTFSYTIALDSRGNWAMVLKEECFETPASRCSATIRKRFMFLFFRGLKQIIGGFFYRTSLSIVTTPVSSFVAPLRIFWLYSSFICKSCWRSLNIDACFRFGSCFACFFIIFR